MSVQRLSAQKVALLAVLPASPVPTIAAIAAIVDQAAPRASLPCTNGDHHLTRRLGQCRRRASPCYEMMCLALAKKRMSL